MKKIVKLFIGLIVILFMGCSNNETKKEPPREKTTGEKVAFVAEFIIENVIYSGYDLGLSGSIGKSNSFGTGSSLLSTSVDGLGFLNMGTFTETTTTTKSVGAGIRAGIGDY